MTEPDGTAAQKKTSTTKKAVIALSIVILLLLVLFALRAAQQNEPPAPFDDVEPRVSFIKSELDPPFTRYSVFASDLDDQELTYEWTLSTSETACTDFTFDGGRATWRHDGAGCSHEDPDGHPGTVTVKVSDGKHVVERTYDGGSAAHDPDPLYP